MAVTGLFACKRKKIVEPDPTNVDGRVMPVSTAVELVHSSILAADGSKGVKNFSLSFAGSYQSGEDSYTFTFDGLFDITQENREKDEASELAFVLKKGDKALLQLFYFKGIMYLDFEPYAHLARITDRNLAETVYELYGEKSEGGVIDAVVQSFPAIAKKVFNDCQYYSEDGVDRYIFTLSVSRLFNEMGSFVSSWDAGFTTTEFLAALHLDDEKIAALTAEKAVTTVECRLKQSVFLSADVETAGKGSFKLDTFTLKSGGDHVAAPSGLSSFIVDYDPRNLSLSGRMEISTSYKEGDRDGNYDVIVNRKFRDVSYPFDYTLKTNYTSGVGLEGELRLTEVPSASSAESAEAEEDVVTEEEITGEEELIEEPIEEIVEETLPKSVYFALRGGYLYVDLSDYGIERFKVKTSEILDDLASTGFTTTDEYDFKDKVRLLTLLSTLRKEEGDVVSYTFTEEMCSLLTEKLGLKGIFGVNSITISWNKANNRLQKLSFSITSGSLTASLTSDTFSFGKAVALSDIEEEADYVDLSPEKSTAEGEEEKPGTTMMIRSSGIVAEQTSFSSEGDFLSALISALSGDEITIKADDPFRYESWIVYGETGKVKTAFFLVKEWNDREGITVEELLNFYYTEKTPDRFYLITPEVSGTRLVKTLPIRSVASFNSAFDYTASARSTKIYLETTNDQGVKIGLQPGMIEWLGEKLSAIYPDLSFSHLLEVECANYELEILGFGMGEHTLSARVNFDSDNYLKIRDLTLSVTFNDFFEEPVFAMDATPEEIYLLDDNDMPDTVNVTFSNEIAFKNIQLINPETEASLWTYENVPDRLTREGETSVATAKVSILGSVISCDITVDRTPVTSVELTNSVYSGHVVTDEENEDIVLGFTFKRYGNDSPKDVLTSYEYITVNERPGKEVKWDITGTETIADLETYGVKPLVKTFFGTWIPLNKSIEESDVFTYPITVVGSKAAAAILSEEIVFVAYDGRDPFDAKSYPTSISVELEDEEEENLKDFTNIEWDLDGVEDVKTSYDFGTDGNHLYDFDNADALDQVYVLVKDCTGYAEYLPVDVRFAARSVQKEDVSFSELKDGVIYVADKKSFKFDPLYIQSLTQQNKHDVLPSSFAVKAGDPNGYTIDGMDWRFTDFDNVPNATGRSGKITMIFGDDISGYQEIEFDYSFILKNITATALLDENHALISDWSKNSGDVFSYAIGTKDKVNAFGYVKPAFVRLTYGTETEDFPIGNAWSWSPTTYDETKLTLKDSKYVGTCSVGSQTLTLELNFGQARIVRAAATQTVLSAKGDTIPTKTIGSDLVLCYSVLDALTGTGLSYWDTANYPASLRVSCKFQNKDTVETAKVDAWNISPILKQENIIEKGYRGTVTAQMKGQWVEINVYILPVTGIYFDSEKNTEKSVKLLTVGNDGKHQVLSYLDSSTYGDSVVAEGGTFDNNLTEITAQRVIPIQNGKWDTREIEAFIKDKTDYYDVEGSFSIYSTIGYSDGEYSAVEKVELTAKLIKSTFENATPQGLPLVALSSQTVGTTLKALEVGPKGRVASFDYDFSLTFNPYYIDCTKEDSYPSHVKVTLNGKECSIPVTWDLSAVKDNKKKHTQSDTTFLSYPAYAVIDLESVGTKRIPVQVRLLTCEISEVWVNGSKGRTINVNCYDSNPLGDNDDEICLDVDVRFAGGDINKYPLKMIFSREDITLPFDGKTYNNISVKVGNESGGYVTFNNYNVTVLQKIVKTIRMKLANSEETVILYDKNTSGFEVTYTYYDEALQKAMLSDEVAVTFEDGSSPITVRAFAEESEEDGIVFTWVGTKGIIFWNPTVIKDYGLASESELQTISFPDQELQVLEPNDPVLFPTNNWEVTYRDGEDDEVTIGELFDTFIPLVKTNPIPVARQTVTIYERDGEGNLVRIYQNTATDRHNYPVVKGYYYLHVAIDKDPGYATGFSEKRIEIKPKDISDFVVFRVDKDPKMVTGNYNGDEYLVDAIIDSKYPNKSIKFRVRLAGSSEEPLAKYPVIDVLYDGSNVIPYVFEVCMNDDAVSSNYTANKTYEFKVKEVELSSDRVELSVSWNGASFTVEVTVDGSALSPQAVTRAEDLTEGYWIRYYENKAGRKGAQVNSFTAGQKYWYLIYVKVGNYKLYYEETTVMASNS